VVSPPPLAHAAPGRARPRIATSWPLLLLVLIAAAIWCWHYERWTIASWRLPTNYSGDAHETLARVQAAAEGDIWPGRSQVIHRLGAPFGAYWNGYPTPDKLLVLALGGLSRMAGLFAAVNIGQLMAQVSAAVSFFLVARWLREWAMVGGLLFAYTYSTFCRGLAHFSLLFTWTVPLGLFAVWLVAGSRRLAWHRPGVWVCLAAAIALGAHNPYNLFFWLQLMTWALVAQWFGPRRRANLQIGLVALALAVAVCALMHLEAWVHVDEPEGAPLLARNYGGTERYALKPVETVIPPRVHRWEPLAFLGSRYARWSDWRGEEFHPYLVLGSGGSRRPDLAGDFDRPANLRAPSAARSGAGDRLAGSLCQHRRGNEPARAIFWPASLPGDESRRDFYRRDRVVLFDGPAVPGHRPLVSGGPDRFRRRGRRDRHFGSGPPKYCPGTVPRDSCRGRSRPRIGPGT
jgi:hypothetical protein